MMIHPEQQNVRAICELADFIDSGFQSFREQVQHLTPQKMAEAAFFAGAGLSLKLIEHFKHTRELYTEDQIEYMTNLLFVEVSDFMEKNGMKLEWEPHVPRRWHQ